VWLRTIHLLGDPNGERHNHLSTLPHRQLFLIFLMTRSAKHLADCFGKAMVGIRDVVEILLGAPAPIASANSLLSIFGDWLFVASGCEVDRDPAGCSTVCL
jgi:hypothetical protein